jgi:hypothetical protein
MPRDSFVANAVASPEAGVASKAIVASDDFQT